MEEAKLTFKRYEKKYLLTREQYERLWQSLSAYIEPDEYFKSTVCSVYYDTPDYALIRRSLDKPVYKEKLRLRSYNVPGEDDMVFLELKKKYKGIVYKRRAMLRAREAGEYLAGLRPAPNGGQVMREIDWFLRQNKVAPRAFIACDRAAYRGVENHELRITFDRDIRWRETELDLTRGSDGRPLLRDGQVLMEIKMPEAAPLWLARILSEQGIFPVGFSKYGTCYEANIMNGVFSYAQ